MILLLTVLFFLLSPYLCDTSTFDQGVDRGRTSADPAIPLLIDCARVAQQLCSLSGPSFVLRGRFDRRDASEDFRWRKFDRGCPGVSMAIPPLLSYGRARVA